MQVMSSKFTLAVGAAAVLGVVGAYTTTSKRRQIIRVARRVVPFEREHATNKLVTQGRAFYPGYSGCGDLWSYVLDVIGAPTAWVNRNSSRRGIRWKEQVNISQPWQQAWKTGARVMFDPKKGLWPRAGDLVLIGQEPQELAHVFVILKRLGPRKYLTAEYGGASNKGSLGVRQFDESGRVVDGWRRMLVGWIDADKIPIDPKWAQGRIVSLLRLSEPERAA